MAGLGAPQWWQPDSHMEQPCNQLLGRCAARHLTHPSTETMGSGRGFLVLGSLCVEIFKKCMYSQAAHMVFWLPWCMGTLRSGRGFLNLGSLHSWNFKNRLCLWASHKAFWHPGTQTLIVYPKPGTTRTSCFIPRGNFTAGTDNQPWDHTSSCQAVDKWLSICWWKRSPGSWSQATLALASNNGTIGIWSQKSHILPCTSGMAGGTTVGIRSIAPLN